MRSGSLLFKNSYLNTDKQAKKWEVLAYNIGNSKSVSIDSNVNEINIIAKIGDVFIPISINAEFIRRYGENIDVRGGFYNSETNYQTIIYNISPSTIRLVNAINNGSNVESYTNWWVTVR